jgi:signal transduction histidine kinase/CheY-like chemotaxis protein/HPt (histidine-containing phosphotransfer) domain-containing protein
VDSIIAPFLDEGGRIVKFISIRHDITAHKAAQRRLIESQAFLERVEKVSGVGGFMVDLKSGMQRWTRQTYRIYDVDEDRALTPDLLNTFLTSEVSACLNSGTGCDVELPTATAAGRAIWIRLAAEIECENGAPVRLVGAVQDVTQRRMLEQQLHEAIAVAQSANRAKSEFLASMSHEIRTPLNAVIGLSYLLQQTTLSEDQRQFLTKIQFATRALLGVVNNVLDLSKIEAGEMPLDIVPFNLPELVGELGQMLAPQAAAKRVELNVLTGSDLPRIVLGDSSRLRQILTNLVHNSIKFTQAGRITLDVSLAYSAPDRIRLRCVVTDTGIGIEPALLARLFTPFTQADASTPRRFGGTGLGLSIARRFVELMGGEIGVSSTPAAGSTFWVEIPFERTAALDDTTQMRRANGPHLLVADPQAAAPDSLAAMVRALGWIPNVADTCETLLRCVEGGEATPRPDVLILSARVLQARAGESESIARLEQVWPLLPPVIIVHAHAQRELPPSLFMRPEDVELVRPVSSSDLFNAVNTAYLNHHGDHDPLSQLSGLDEPRSQWLLGVQVLAVDDSDINLEVVRHILEGQGASVATCSDGTRALEYVRTHHRQLDVVLMDVQMPLLDGNEVTRRIRGDLNLRSLPIVALTAGTLAGERTLCLQAGMNDFVSKPFDPPVLIRKVRRLVQQVRGAPLSGAGVHAHGLDTSATWSALPSLDAALLRKMYGQEVGFVTSLLRRVLQKYADFGQPPTAPLDDAAARDELRRRLHKLKGSAGLLGATHLMQCASAAEMAVQDGCDPQLLGPALRRLSSAYCILRAEAQPPMDQSKPLAQTVPMAVRVAHPEDPVLEDCNRRHRLGQDIAQLCELLDHQDLQAIDRFHELTQSWHELPQMAQFEHVREAIETLHFTLASEQLRAMWSTPSPAPRNAAMLSI